MDLRALLPSNHVLLQFRAAGRLDIYRQLTTPLLKTRIVSEADAFIQAVERREQQITTRVTTGIAFPHARSPAVHRLGLTVGIAKDPGLPFDGSDEDLVRLFFLIAVPSFAPTAHLPLLQKLANFVQEEEKVEGLLNCTTPRQVVGRLARYKG